MVVTCFFGQSTQSFGSGDGCHFGFLRFVGFIEELYPKIVFSFVVVAFGFCLFVFKKDEKV